MYDQDNGENQIKSNKINLFVLGGVFYIFYFGGRGKGGSRARTPASACKKNKMQRAKGRKEERKDPFPTREIPNSSVLAARLNNNDKLYCTSLVPLHIRGKRAWY